MPTAEHYAHALVTAARHTGERAASFVDQDPDSKFRHYALHALLAVFPKADRTQVAAALGAPGRSAYFYRTSLWHVLGDGPHRKGPIEWWDADVLAKTIKAVQAITPKPTPSPLRAAAPPLKMGALPPPKPEQRKEVKVPGETERIVVRNGVTLDLLDRTVFHRGVTVTLSDDGLRLVAMLARVMPAFLPTDRLADKVFGVKADSHIWLKGLVGFLNPILQRARLEVRAIPKMGYMLADLDA